MKKDKKILIIIATHGDEGIGLELVQRLKSKKMDNCFDWLVANPKALARNQRFVDVDLNRSYPGRKNSAFYEERLACRNLKTAESYRYVIDIHEASKGINNFIIIPKETLPKSFPLGLINLKEILLWPDPKGPLGSVLESTIELEFGMKDKDRQRILKKAEQIVENFVRCIDKGEFKKILPSQKIYYVYGKLFKKDFPGRIDELKDFKETKASKDGFYPLLVGQYIKEGIVCYKMRRMRS